MAVSKINTIDGRISYEVRGLKFVPSAPLVHLLRSHLIRGAWIEITQRSVGLVELDCRISYEVRGLKFLIDLVMALIVGRRISYEVRGLKYV